MWKNQPTTFVNISLTGLCCYDEHAFRICDPVLHFFLDPIALFSEKNTKYILFCIPLIN